MSTSKTIAEVLREGAEVLERRGWTTGNYADNRGRVCLMGACATALGYEPSGFDENLVEISPLFYRAAETICYSLGRVPGNDAIGLVAQWNDHECRDAREAAAVLRSAAGAS